ncbi:MAG: hypothetical protein OEY90_06125 [Candidatus Bathyarchaeota archaeon]|nr:hypothetical protein [Candidatus Bathyarchaeota archaeon]
MKKIVCAHLLFFLLMVTFITSVHASVTVQAIIDQDIHVAFDLENINSTIYWTIKNGNLINTSTIPNIILKKLKQQNLTHVDVYTQPVVFNNSTSSIYVAFSLTGSDILNFTVNTKAMTKTYHVRTEWRKFQVNLTNGFSLNFNEYFGEPVERWQRINYTLNAKTHPAYYHNFTDSNTIDPACYFILPAAATNVQVTGDILTFELPLSFGDSLLNSPFLILGALIVVNIAFFLYRRVKK